MSRFSNLVDLIVGNKVGKAGFAEDFGDGGSQRGLSVVDVSDGADVEMGFAAVVFAGKAELLAADGSSGQRLDYVVLVVF